MDQDQTLTSLGCSFQGSSIADPSKHLSWLLMVTVTQGIICILHKRVPSIAQAC